MAIFYIDADNGDDVTNDGSSPTKTNGDGPFKTLHKYTENARNAGDIAILRRGMTARYDDGGDLAFTSDGIIENPIIIEADYGNAFGDDVDLSVTATATLVFGSKTITFSADVSGVIAVGDWIYVASEDAKDFAYEVASVSTVTVTLFLPYKGDQAGSGKTMTNMQDPPIWNTAAGNFQWEFNTDDNWKIQGIHIRGTDINGIVEFDSSGVALFKDCIIEGNGTSARGVTALDEIAILTLLKCRFFNCNDSFRSNETQGSFTGVLIKDCLIDGNSSSNSSGFNVVGGWDDMTIEESEFKNNTFQDLRFLGNNRPSTHYVIKGRNLSLNSGTPIITAGQAILDVFIEDYGGAIGDNRYFTSFSVTDTTPFYQSETSTVRSGGSNKSIKVTPSTSLSTNWEWSRIKIFELPIYATTDSKKYEIFFRPTATADWTADPTNTELWIEIEYWGHASNNFRRILKSTEVIDMNGSTTFTALSVTVAPAQEGVAYLKCYYAKTKESAKANTFFVDPIPVIT